jgi:hypothetical protein
MAQAITFRAVGAGAPSYDTASEALDSSFSAREADDEKTLFRQSRQKQMIERISRSVFCFF